MVWKLVCGRCGKAVDHMLIFMDFGGLLEENGCFQPFSPALRRFAFT